MPRGKPLDTNSCPQSQLPMHLCLPSTALAWMALVSCCACWRPGRSPRRSAAGSPSSSCNSKCSNAAANALPAWPAEVAGSLAEAAAAWLASQVRAGPATSRHSSCAADRSSCSNASCVRGCKAMLHSSSRRQQPAPVGGLHCSCWIARAESISWGGVSGIKYAGQAHNTQITSMQATSHRCTPMICQNTALSVSPGKRVPNPAGRAHLAQGSVGPLLAGAPAGVAALC